MGKGKSLRRKSRSRSNAAASGGGNAADTRVFLQRMCWRQPASVDMTRQGFVRDSRERYFAIIIKPLKDKLTDLCAGS